MSNLRDSNRFKQTY